MIRPLITLVWIGLGILFVSVFIAVAAMLGLIAVICGATISTLHQAKTKR